MDDATTAARLCARLDEWGVAYQRHDHPPVYTCEEAERLGPRETDAIHTKNLFLRDKKGRRHWLLVTTCEKAVDLKGLAPRLGADNLSLGSADRLLRHLGVTPGAVTLLAVVNDPERVVKVVIDRSAWTGAPLRCHPLVNTATLVIPAAGIERVLERTGHEPTFVDVPVRPPAATG
jgi:Ala-tRNA(Pro) deacylase